MHTAEDNHLTIVVHEHLSQLVKLLVIFPVSKLLLTLWSTVVNSPILWQFLEFFTIFCFWPLMDNCYRGKENVFILLNKILQRTLWQEIMGLHNFLKKFQKEGLFGFLPVPLWSITCSFPKHLYIVPRRWTSILYGIT